MIDITCFLVSTCGRVVKVSVNNPFRNNFSNSEQATYRTFFYFFSSKGARLEIWWDFPRVFESRQVRIIFFAKYFSIFFVSCHKQKITLRAVTICANFFCQRRQRSKVTSHGARDLLRELFFFDIFLIFFSFFFFSPQNIKKSKNDKTQN